MVYITSLFEYHPVKAVHIHRVAIGPKLTRMDVDILQALNTKTIDEVKVFINTVYNLQYGETVESVLKDHYDLLSFILEKAKRTAYGNEITLYINSDDISNFILNRIMTDGTGHVFLEILEVE